MTERRLVEVRRRVPRESAGMYDSAWRELETAVTGTGGHAWRFRSAEDADLYIEFLEFRAAADPRSRSDVRSALRALDSLAPGPAEEWVDATPRH